MASLSRIGRAEVQKAVQVAPSYYEGHLFLGLILENQDHDNAGAVTQFNDFLADGPPSAELPQVAPLVDGRLPGRGGPGARGVGAGHDPDLSPVGPAAPPRRVANAAPNAATSSSVVFQPTLTRSEWLGSAPMASSTGDGSMLSEEHAEPECTATPARSSPMSTGSASTPPTPRQTRWGTRSPADAGPTTSTPSTGARRLDDARDLEPGRPPPSAERVVGAAEGGGCGAEGQRARGAPRARPGARAPVLRRR